MISGDISNRSYDSNGFVDEATNWRGNITKTERNDPNHKGVTTTLTEAKGTAVERITSTVWHTTYRLPELITTPINVTDREYEANGDLESLTITGDGKTRSWSLFP